MRARDPRTEVRATLLEAVGGLKQALAFDAIPEMGVFLRTRVPDVKDILAPRLAVTLIAGTISLFSVKQEVFPEFALDLVTVSVEYLGAAPEEVENDVSRPIEEALGVIGGLSRISSISREAVHRNRRRSLAVWIVFRQSARLPVGCRPVTALLDP